MNTNRFIVAIIALLAGSCSKEVQLTDKADIAKQQCVIQCRIEDDAPDTKTALLPDATTVVWRTKDEIAILSAAGEKEIFQIKTGIGSSSAQFAGPELGAGPFTAIYPASAEVSTSENVLSFKLPAVQTYVQDSFGVGASPMVASVTDLSAPISFRNLCGLLCIKLTAKPSFRVSKLVVKDLSGIMLWGDCLLTLDGNEGTDAQELSIEQGTDEITLMMSSPLTLSESTPTKFYVAIPAGSFEIGFSLSIYDEMGRRVSLFKTHNPETVIERSIITNMKSLDIKTESPDPARRGYYKDVFMDSGVKVTSFTYIAAFPYLGWDYEYFATPQGSYRQEDIDMQAMVFVMSEDDENGALLYPDRQPRFRCIYVNGGDAKGHGRSLGEEGRKTICEFVDNGGSYVGTCAGAYLATRYRHNEKEPVPEYLGIHPGRMIKTYMLDTFTDMIVPEDSPLRYYYSFEETLMSIRHWDGGYLSESPQDWIPGTEVLTRFSNCPTGYEVNNGKVATWAYKPNEKVGRLVLTGSHPEKEIYGDRRDLFAAMLLYAADGNGEPQVKASLVKGETYDCTALSSAGTPEHARIGDRQYHHFTVDIPEDAKDIRITLESEWPDDLYLSLRKNGLAWFSEADYALTDDGPNKVLSIPSLEPGTWYVSVYAPNTVTAVLTTYASKGSYYKYTGKTHLLNGIPYTLRVDWNGHEQSGNAVIDNWNTSTEPGISF